MKTFPFRVVLRALPLLLCAVSMSYAQGRIVEPADIIVIHGRVYTEDSKQPWAQAVAIYRGKIVAVGDDPVIERMRGMGTKVINAGGKLVLPGFVDCHIHFIDGSFSLGRVNLEGAKDASDIQKRLREYAAEHPGDDWILGRGWNYAMFGPEALPHKKYLDEIFPNRPVFLEGYDGHTYWANSKALAMAGITSETQNPPNGTIVRDSKTGEATGALKESAENLVSKIIPKPSRAEQLLALRAGMKWANEHGITRVHSAGGDFEVLDLFDEMRRRGDLTLRMYVAYFLNPPELRPQDLDAVEHAHKKFHDDWIDAGAVKFMVDGVVESHTAAMFRPYADDPSLKGKLFWDPAKYKAAVAELDKRGLQLFTHAIGDYGVRTALDAYENAEKRNHGRDHRPRIEHIETIALSDIPRFGKLGVIASMQPLHAYPDEDALKSWQPSVGAERAQRAWAWHGIQAAGGVLAFGSDWPIVTLSPWPGLQNAVTRETTEGQPKGGWIPAQRISLAEAIKGYTLNAAFAGHREKTEGSLEPGKLADMIVVSQDVFKVDPLKIGETRVLLTMVGGHVVYRSDNY